MAGVECRHIRHRWPYAQVDGMPRLLSPVRNGEGDAARTKDIAGTDTIFGYPLTGLSDLERLIGVIQYLQVFARLQAEG